jgi:hypothetical protein
LLSCRHLFCFRFAFASLVLFSCHSVCFHVTRFASMSALVSLLSHLCFTFVSLLFHFCFTFVSLLFHFCFTFVSLLFYFCFTLCMREYCGGRACWKPSSLSCQFLV